MRRTKEDASETMAKLIEVARTHFTKQGYAEAALEDIVAEAGLTRGALYHHFGSKKGLFRIVLEAVQKEIAERVEAEAAKSEEVWEQLYNGCGAFVAAAVEPRSKRIMLLDGPAVLGWETWRALDERHSMRLLREQLLTMQRLGSFKPASVEATVHILSGALNEAALWIAQCPDAEAALEETMSVIADMLLGFGRPAVRE
ncbi:TetR/AcrR family transcriptional regulator [Paenibacillus hodogayensis]|uniref:TetR/AcrR family transcriptional regulator n=1 Tax=Paenibacillus hodogayensis TaxID=279208 RepID=A0ABV5W3M9_9BACL